MGLHAALAFSHSSNAVPRTPLVEFDASSSATDVICSIPVSAGALAERGEPLFTPRGDSSTRDSRHSRHSDAPPRTLAVRSIGVTTVPTKAGKQ
jgi:hypothetical protein